jgi:hypothetical protein
MAQLPKGRRQRTKQLPRGGEVRLWVRSHPPSRRWRRGLTLVLIALALWAALTLLVFSLRWGFQLMVNPEAAPWLQGTFFGSEASPAETITLDALEAAIAAEGHQLGEPLRLSEAQTQEDFWLLPVQTRAAKTVDPATIRELRLYRLLAELPEPLLSPVATLPVDPLNDDVVLAPLRGTPQQIAPTRHPFPLTRVSQLTPFPTEGFWLMLQGQWQRSGTTLRYGQVVYFDPRRQSLEGLLRWSTPASRLPYWTDLDGAAPADLLIDETVGLEPALRGYRLQRRQGLGATAQLLPITLTGVPADILDSSGAYHRALLQARSGLWTGALNEFQTLKSKLAQKWPPAAEAQFKLVKLHADRTRQQADRSWSVPSQQILTSLIDGRWEIALKQLEATPEAQEALMRTLAVEEGRFWKRVTAALRVQPAAPAVLVWGGLILKAQQDQQTALTWLAEQKASAAARDRFLAVANPPVRLAQTPQSNAAVPVSTSLGEGVAVQALMGAATWQPTVNLAQWQPWQTPQALRLNPSDAWYEITVLGWQQGGSWALDGQTPPWSGSPGAALKQSLAAAVANLTLIPQPTGQGAEIPLQIKGLRLDNGRLKLLAAGSGQTTGLAYSAQSLLRLNAAEGFPASDNGVVAAALQSQLEPLAPPLAAAELAALLASAPLHTRDMTGNGQPEWLLTLPQGVLDRLATLGVGADRTAPKTLIVNSEGQILYSDLFRPQTLTALTRPQQSQAVALVVRQSDHYWLQTYDLERRQFD